MKKLCMYACMCVALLMVQVAAYAQSPNGNGNSKDINLGHRTVKVQEFEGDYSYLATSGEPLTDEEFAALNKHYDTKFQEKFEKLHAENEKASAVDDSFLSPFHTVGVICCLVTVIVLYLKKLGFADR